MTAAATRKLTEGDRDPFTLFAPLILSNEAGSGMFISGFKEP